MEVVKEFFVRLKTAFLAGFGKYRILITKSGGQIELRNNVDPRELDDFDLKTELTVMRDMRERLTTVIRRYDAEEKSRSKG